MKKTVLFSALIALFTIFITPTISYAEDTGEEGWWQDPGTGINYDSYEECVSQNSGYGCDFVGENFIGDIGEDDSGEYDDGNYMCCDLWHDSPYTSYEECAMDCGDPSQCTPGSDWNMACDSENGDGCDPDSRCAQCCIQYGSGFIDEYNVCQSNDLFPPDCESSMFTWEEDGMLYACNSCTDAYALGGTGTDINCNYLKALYYEHTDDDEPSYGYLLTCSDGGEITDAGIRDVCGNNTDCYNTLTNSSLTYAELLCMGGDTDISDDYNKDKLNEILAMADYRYNAGCAPKISGPRCDVMDAVYAHYRNTGIHLHVVIHMKIYIKAIITLFVSGLFQMQICIMIATIILPKTVKHIMRH